MRQAVSGFEGFCVSTGSANFVRLYRPRLFQLVKLANPAPHMRHVHRPRCGLSHWSPNCCAELVAAHLQPGSPGFVFRDLVQVTIRRKSFDLLQIPTMVTQIKPLNKNPVSSGFAGAFKQLKDSPKQKLTRRPSALAMAMRKIDATAIHCRKNTQRVSCTGHARTGRDKR